ncbi:MAG: YraN family protein [Alphaproteobacteria bacterium]|nr:YraN family protein [Alphaproteobacteria bacterium]MBT4711759.1 YraN family protein [Alphaproteobacteria bacterium]MBT5860366.1 YraN family protein [Alphaproteobacteria bacterium]
MRTNTAGKYPGNTKRRRAEEAGRRAEDFCAWVLRLKGYRIVAKRSRQPGGEIDLIAQRGGVLVFIEVKARANTRDAMESISKRQQSRIIRAAESFVANNAHFAGLADLTLRFDVMLVAPRRWPVHIPNAWHILA